MRTLIRTLNTPVNKAIVAGLGMIFSVLTATYADNMMDMNEEQHLVTTVVSVIVSVYTVWRVPNANPHQEDTR